MKKQKKKNDGSHVDCASQVYSTNEGEISTVFFLPFFFLETTDTVDVRI